MKAAKNLVVRVDGRALTVEIDISEDDLISTMISSLESFINEGFAFRITHTSKQPLSRSQSMSSRILKNIPDLEEWGDDLKNPSACKGRGYFCMGSNRSIKEPVDQSKAEKGFLPYTLLSDHLSNSY